MKASRLQQGGVRHVDVDGRPTSGRGSGALHDDLDAGIVHGIAELLKISASDSIGNRAVTVIYEDFARAERSMPGISQGARNAVAVTQPSLSSAASVPASAVRSTSEKVTLT